MKPLAQFLANMTKTASASSVQFILTLCTTPIMTRLYEPAAYATFGIINTLATVIVGVGLVSLPNAYCAEKEGSVRVEMVKTMLLLLVGLGVLASLIALVMGMLDGIKAVYVSRPALLLLPVLVITYGIRQILVNVAIQRANFTRLSLAQMLEPACSRGGSIVMGARFGGHPAFILGAVAFGHLGAIGLLIKMLPKSIVHRWREVPAFLPHMSGLLRSFSDFVFYNTAAQQIQPVVMLALQMGIAAFFSSELAGEYIFAVSILTLPVSLVALATAPVVYHHFIKTEKVHPTRLAYQYVAITALYLFVGLCILFPVWLFGEEIFSFVFSDTWRHAGAIAARLSIAYVTAFAVTGVQSILMVTRHLKLQFLLEVATAIPALLAAIFCFQNFRFDTAIFYLSLIWLLRNSVILCACFLVAFHHSRHVSHD